MPSESSARETRRKQCIGRYEVVQYLATGGMGAVYKAIDTVSGKEVALKILPDEIAVKPGMLERFQQEAIHASKLHHDHIVTLYEHGEANHVHYLAMELIDGIDLHEYVSRKGPLGPDEARVIIAQAAEALEHAHEQGIIHRDIKPSNFLITRNKGRLWVKMTDFGLAREVNDDEFRVTRAGSTVGTVDYMAPEQARDSRATDRRSDIYSLGCTLYFMLSGRPPFPEGGLTERILQHAEEEPVDICTLNRLVPHTLAAVLQRMLAKRPANRYQTAAALLEDLERLRSGDGPRHLEIFTVLDELDQTASPRRHANITMAIAERGDPSPCIEDSVSPRRRPDSSTRRRLRKDDTEEETPPKTQAVPALLPQGRSRQILLVAAPLMVLLAMVGGVLTWWLLPRTATDRPQTLQVDVGKEGQAPEPIPVRSVPLPQVQPGPNKAEAQPAGKSASPKDSVPPIVVDPPPGGNRAPPLNPSGLPIQVEALRKEFLKPLVQTSSPRAEQTLRVSRAAVPGDGKQFVTLAEAIAAAPENQETTIEIHDNGPLFEPAIDVRNRTLILRAARGYRPLLVWDRDRVGSSRAPAFLSVTGGSLTLEHLDLVQQVSDAGQPEDTVLCKVAEGDFQARGCTFSVAGRSRGMAAAIQMSGTPRSGKAHCRLAACYVRGSDTVALDLRSPGVDVLLEDCLIVGGSRPLLEVAGQTVAAPTILRVLRSTLVASQTILRIRPHTVADVQPQVHWTGWDALLARCSGEQGGEMIVLANGAGSNGLQWQAVNSLYAGWQNLLGGREPLGAGSLTAWHTRWGRADGDRAVPQTWPARISLTPWDESPEAYRTTGSPVWFAGSAGTDVVGCNLAVLPPVREAWQTLIFGRTSAEPLVPTELSAPEIPAPMEGVYHGEKLNVNNLDLGEHLDKIQHQQKMRLGPRVVLHLSGTGERPTSPIRVQGTTLVLWFEPPPEEGAAPLTLTFKGKENTAGLIVVKDGNLELLGAALKFEGGGLAPHPRHLVRVNGGNLRVVGSRLSGPLGQAPKTFEGLIGFDGSGESSAAQVRDCAIVDSILTAGGTCIHSIGVGTRLRLRNCVVVAARDAIFLDPGVSVKARLNSQCFLESCTIAARRSVVRLGDAPDLLPLEPFLVQARGNVFLDPFVGNAFEAAMVVFDGDALARGLLMWQGDDNGYDKRLPHYVAPTSMRTGDRPHQGYAIWSRIWGTPGDRDAVVMDLPARAFDVGKLPLALLQLPASVRTRRNEPLGADLVQLRILKKPEKPKSPRPSGP